MLRNIFVIDWNLQIPENIELIKEGRVRDWKSLLGKDAVFTVWDPASGFHRLTEHGFEELRLSSGVIVLHGPSDDLIQEISDQREAGRSLVAIRVSGAPYGGPPSELQWFYIVRTPVVYNDTGFSERFKLFWNDLIESGGKNPNFALLEPTTIPENILAYNLAVEYLDEPDCNFGLLADAADAEYGKIQPYLNTLSGKVADVNLQVPPVTALKDSPNTKDGIRYKSYCNAIDLLREDI